MFLIYGAGGYTGRLIASELARRDHPMVLAGRSEAPLRDLPVHPGSTVRVFALDDSREVARGLEGVSAVLNAAGPFSRTALPLARACLARGVHYMDIAGEVAEHEALLALADEARAAGAMVLPGVGFGCVPTELAAVEAARRLGMQPERIVLAYETVGGASRGTLDTLLRIIHCPGVQRRDGALVATRPGAVRRKLDLGGGSALVVTNPWRADLISVFVSLGVANIETLATFPAAARFLMSWPRLTASRAGQALVERTIRTAPAVPSAQQLAAGSTRVLAQAFASDQVATVTLRGPEAYVFTARTAAALAERALQGAAIPGFVTPSMLLSWPALEALAGSEVGP